MVAELEVSTLHIPKCAHCQRKTQNNGAWGSDISWITTKILLKYFFCCPSSSVYTGTALTLAAVFRSFNIKYSPPMPGASAISPRSPVGKPEVLALQTVTPKSHYNSSKLSQFIYATVGKD
jgi:hypothetical protein